MTRWAADLQKGVINEEAVAGVPYQSMTLMIFEDTEQSTPINEVIEVYGYLMAFDPASSQGPGFFKEEEEVKAERRKYQLTVLRMEKQGGELTSALLRGSLAEPLTKEYLGSHVFKLEMA